MIINVYNIDCLADVYE